MNAAVPEKDLIKALRKRFAESDRETLKAAVLKRYSHAASSLGTELPLQPGPQPGGKRPRDKNPLRLWLKAHPEVNQAELARRVGYQPAMMSMVINGRREFSAKRLKKCHEVTGIATDDLLNLHKLRPHYKRKPGRRHRPPPD